MEDTSLEKEKERRDQYSFSFKFCREIIANYILPLLLTNMGQRPRMEKIKSLQEILSKGNNNLNHRTLAGRRDLKGHQERSKIMTLVRKLDTTLQFSKTVRFHADSSAESWASWGQKWKGLRAEPLWISVTAQHLGWVSLCSVVFQLTASGPRKEWNYGSGRPAAMQMAVSGCRQAEARWGEKIKHWAKPKNNSGGFVYSLKPTEKSRGLQGTLRRHLSRVPIWVLSAVPMLAPI